jgi:hypothetical protein
MSITKLKINSQSGIVITGLKNPKPVEIIDELNGLTDESSKDKQTMPEEYFGYDSTLELDDKLITAPIALRLISLESFGSVIRLGAKYPSEAIEIQKGFSIPVQNAKNAQAIEAFWLDKLPKDALEVFEAPKIAEVAPNN